MLSAFLYNLFIWVLLFIAMTTDFILSPITALLGYSPIALVYLVGFIIFSLTLWLFWFLGALPAKIARKRGLPWGTGMAVVGFVLLLCTFIGWLLLLIVAMIKDPPSDKVVYYVNHKDEQ